MHSLTPQCTTSRMLPRLTVRPTMPHAGRCRIMALDLSTDDPALMSTKHCLTWDAPAMPPYGSLENVAYTMLCAHTGYAMLFRDAQGYPTSESACSTRHFDERSVATRSCQDRFGTPLECPEQHGFLQLLRAHARCRPPSPFALDGGDAPHEQRNCLMPHPTGRQAPDR
ncbi:hypothetical protein OH77DRAFT_701528 [Trametes cingulata]|nr:hypothetical protein OH77DRAFT_701528 [Trametes cingulata]